jgi:phosphotransferase system IIA component
MGIDTVELNGEGFTIMVSDGERVDSTTQLAEIDLPLLKQKGKDDTIMVVFPELAHEKISILNYGKQQLGKEVGTIKN